MEDLQSRLALSPLVADIARAICAAVLYSHHLEAVEGLRKDALKAFVQVFGLVIDGNDDRYLHNPFLLFYLFTFLPFYFFTLLLFYLFTFQHLYAFVEDSHIEQTHDA